MREQILDDDLARRFLLGRLPPEEEERIQELAFEDRDMFVFLESVEDDLIDEFLHGELSAEEQRSFESHFLSQPGRRHNLRISEVLQRQFDSIPDVPSKKRRSFVMWFREQSTWVQVSITLGAIALVGLAIWIFTLVREARQPAPIQAGPDRPAAIPSPQFEVSPSVQPSTSPAHVENKPKSLAPEKQKSLAPYALLSPSALSRGEGVQKLPLARDTSSMSIELALISQTSFRTYEAALENEAGTVLRVWPNLKAERLTSGKALKIDLPAALLKPQEFYRIAVSGVNSDEKKEIIARYPFEVVQ